MDVDQFFHWAGDKLGQAIRVVVTTLTWFFNHVHAAFDSFVSGLTNALGIDASWFSIAVLVIGLLMLGAAGHSLFRRAWFAAIIWLVLGLVVLSWLIR